MTTRTTTRKGKAVKDRYLTIRIPSDIDQELRTIASENVRTLAAQVLHYIKQGVRNRNKIDSEIEAADVMCSRCKPTRSNGE